MISGNQLSGVFLYGVSASNNLIPGNFIGTVVNGKVGVSNGVSGVELEIAPVNQIGGTTPGAGNLVSGNLDTGIYLVNAAGNRIQGNRVGTDVSGMLAIANQFGGIALIDSSDTL